MNILFKMGLPLFYLFLKTVRSTAVLVRFIPYQWKNKLISSSTLQIIGMHSFIPFIVTVLIRPNVYFSYHTFIRSSHSCSLIISVIVWESQFEISAGLIYSIAEWHTFIVSLLSCCCSLKKIKKMFLCLQFVHAAFMCIPIPPHHWTIFTDLSASAAFESQHSHQLPPPLPVCQNCCWLMFCLLIDYSFQL